MPRPAEPGDGVPMPYVYVWITLLALFMWPLCYFLGYTQGFASGKNVIYENYTVTVRQPPLNYGAQPH